jgi:hypothetical protein
MVERVHLNLTIQRKNVLSATRRDISNQTAGRRGGREGQGPKDNRYQGGKNYQNHTNQAQESINNSLNDISYMAWPAETSQQFS